MVFVFRFSTKHKTTVKDDLDIDGMVIYLCAEITSGYHYLFQLATPKLDSNEIVSYFVFLHPVKHFLNQKKRSIACLSTF